MRPTRPLQPGYTADMVATPDDDDDDDNDASTDDKSESVPDGEAVAVAVTRRPTLAFMDSGGRPSGGGGGSRNHTGAVYVFSRKRKQFQIKWSILGNGSLRWFNEETSLAIPKEMIQLSHVFRKMAAWLSLSYPAKTLCYPYMG